MSIIKLDETFSEKSQQYIRKLTEESNINFHVLLGLISSYWRSTIEGPEYTKHLKALAIELARIRMSLSMIHDDINWSKTRTQFLYQVMTYMMFNRDIVTDMSDVDFRNFMVELVKIYFDGSIPTSLEQAVELLTDGNVTITELFDDKNSDISDQFGFDVAIEIDDVSSGIMSDFNVRTVLDIVRPAHTLYKLKFILKDEWTGVDNTDDCSSESLKIHDEYDWRMLSSGYEDFRKDPLGVYGVDTLGIKVKKGIADEDHSSDF